MSDLVEDMAYWRQACDEATNKGAALVAWGIWAGLRLAQDGSLDEAHMEVATQLYDMRIEIERLQTLKTPASRQLLNITKALLDNAAAEIERLQTALDRIAK